MSDIKMHLRCYDKRPDVKSVIHAHPPGATGFAVAHKAMDMYNISYEEIHRQVIRS